MSSEPSSFPNKGSRVVNPLQAAVVNTAAEEPLKEVRALGYMAILPIVLFALLTTAELALRGWGMWKDPEDKEFIRVLGAIGVSRIIFYVLGGFWFLRWTYRFALNAKRVSPRNPDIHPPSALGGYFIPLLNLFAPYQQMQEMVEVCQRRSGRYDVAPLLRRWWLAWWGMNVVWVLSKEYQVPATLVGEGLLTWVASLSVVKIIYRSGLMQAEIQPPFEVVERPKPRPNRRERSKKEERPKGPAYDAAKPQGNLPRRKPLAPIKPKSSPEQD